MVVFLDASNAAFFKTSYPDYTQRINRALPEIGVETDIGVLRDYKRILEEYVRESALGLSKEETNIIALVYADEQHNKRFDNNPFIHPDFGGNTAEHPIFTGYAVDAVREEAGYRFKEEKLDDPEYLSAAKFVQEAHLKTFLHDTPELVDISLSEQLATGANYKEYKQEKYIPAFKFQLAAYAISKGEPEYYIHTLSAMRRAAQEEKKRLYALAVKGDISGDQFVDGLGEFIGKQMNVIKRKVKKESGFALKDAANARYSKASSQLIEVYGSCGAGKVRTRA